MKLSNKPSLLILDFSKDISGSAIALLRLLTVFSDRKKIEIVVIPGSYLAHELSRLGYRIHEYSVPRITDYLQLQKVFSAVFLTIRYQFFLLKLFRKNKYKRILVNSSINVAGTPFLLCAKFCSQLKTQWWVHELEQKPKWLFFLFRKNVSWLSDQIYCVSNPVLKFFPKKGILLPNSVLHVKDEIQNKSLDDGNVYWLGSLHQRKGLQYLPRILRNLQKHLKVNKLVLIVSVTKEKKALLEECLQDLKEVISVEIHRNELHPEKILESNGILIQTSVEAESFSLSVLEAMAQGMLVLSSPLGGVQDFGVHLKNLYFLDSSLHFDSKEMSQFINDKNAVYLLRKNALLTAKSYSADNSAKILFSEL